MHVLPVSLAQLHSFCSLFLKLVNKDKCLFCLWQCLISTAPFKKDKYSITFSFLLVVSFININKDMIHVDDITNTVLNGPEKLHNCFLCNLLSKCLPASSICLPPHMVPTRKTSLMVQLGRRQSHICSFNLFPWLFLCKAMPKPKSYF